MASASAKMWALELAPKKDLAMARLMAAVMAHKTADWWAKK